MAVPVGCQLSSEQLISTHLAPTEAMRAVTCFTLKQRRRTWSDRFFHTFGEVLPEHSIEVCGVRLLA